MEKLILIVLTLVSIAHGNEFNILSSPKSIVFKGNSEIPSSAISDVFAASLGYSVYSMEPWDGMSIADPFHTAKCAVSIVIEDAEKLKFDNAKSFEITGNDFYVENPLIFSKVMDHSHLAVNINLNNQHYGIATPIGQIEQSSLSGPNTILSSKDKGDKEFVDQIEYLQGLTNVLSSMEAKPAFINIQLSMKSLSKKASRSEANKLLTSTIKKLNDVLQKVYGGDALIVAITAPADTQHSRSKRAINNPDENTYNVADLSSTNFPVIFNIIFWFSIILIFALIAISLALSNVEDKDSIIYRMTGARGKKDN